MERNDFRIPTRIDEASRPLARMTLGRCSAETLAEYLERVAASLRHDARTNPNGEPLYYATEVAEFLEFVAASRIGPDRHQKHCDHT